MRYQDFFDTTRKAITLIGMSGCGKTHISSVLEKDGWNVYSCDHEIGARYLKDELEAQNSFSRDDISALSTFIGKVGNEEKGGFALDLFLQRQKAYYDAECAAITQMSAALDVSDQNFIHDSTGSLCEIMDDVLIEKIGKKTLFIYLEIAPEDEREILKRAQDYPKPLFFPPSQFQGWLEDYMHETQVHDISGIEPDGFARWVFPKLFESRKPKYKRLADLYGLSVPALAFSDLRSADQFLDILEKHMSVLS